MILFGCDEKSFRQYEFLNMKITLTTVARRGRQGHFNLHTVRAKNSKKVIIFTYSIHSRILKMCDKYVTSLSL